MKSQILFLLTIYVVTINSPSASAWRTYNILDENPLRNVLVASYDRFGKVIIENITETLRNWLEPQTLGSIENITMMLYTQANPTDLELIEPVTLQSIQNLTNFNSSRTNYFLMAGWRNNYQSSMNTLLRDALLGQHDVNVFVVDWSSYSMKDYVTAKTAVVTGLGIGLGKFIQEMMNNYNLTSNDVVFYGHSLGAHLAGKTGATMTTKPSVIVGLDPAGPLFTVANTKDRIDPTDGNYVEILHTNGLQLGFRSSIGDSDFFANNGLTQPGCDFDITGLCSHVRAFQLMAESIKKCNSFARSCSSYFSYSRGLCAKNKESHMGCFDIDTAAEEDYYFKTNAQSPYFISDAN